MNSSALVLTLLLLVEVPETSLYLPIKVADRKSIESVQLTDIGHYRIMRRERKGVPAHFHTGIDIMRPGANYESEPIFAIAPGTVISARYDGPFAQVIVAHENDGIKFWTVYEHIAEIRVKPNDKVDPQVPFARFMNKGELNQHGSQFDHFHFEVLKVAPLKLTPNARNPTRLYSSYTLLCQTAEDLEKYFYDPLDFLKGNQKN